MEATPEDQHSHQGNPNEFRSMRDHMHPPRMSAPSCIVPPTEQLVIRPHIVPLLPTFHGMESENPYAHIKEFEDVSKENEKFYECWERYMEAINACPHHGFDTWLLVSYFYDGMSSSMKQLLETMCGGDFMSKNPEEAMDFLSYVTEVSRDGMNRTKENYDKKIGGARTKKMHEVQPCSICQSYEYLVEECLQFQLLEKCLEIKQMSLDNSSPIAMLCMETLTTQVGETIQIFHGSQEHLNTNSRLNHLNKLQVLNKQ
ncbi:hypothetical protein AAG906_019912 [Vitis piasezkii]